MNLLTSNLQCVECGCTELIKDHKRSEIYCSKCGLVLIDNSQMEVSKLALTDSAIPGKEDMIKLRRYLTGFILMENAPKYQKKQY